MDKAATGVRSFLSTNGTGLGKAQACRQAGRQAGQGGCEGGSLLFSGRRAGRRLVLMPCGPRGVAVADAMARPKRTLLLFGVTASVKRRVSPIHQLQCVTTEMFIQRPGLCLLPGPSHRVAKSEVCWSPTPSTVFVFI